MILSYWGRIKGFSNLAEAPDSFQWTGPVSEWLWEDWDQCADSPSDKYIPRDLADALADEMGLAENCGWFDFGFSSTASEQLNAMETVSSNSGYDFDATQLSSSDIASYMSEIDKDRPVKIGYNVAAHLTNSSGGHAVAGRGYSEISSSEHILYFNNTWDTNNSNTGSYNSFTYETAFNAGYMMNFITFVPPPDLKISSSDISTDPSGQTAPGTQVDITATIHNEGGIDAACDVWIYYDDQSSGTCVTIDNFYSVSVAAGSSEQIQTTWDTSGFQTISYPIYVVISNSNPVESDTSNNEAHTDYALPVELVAISVKRTPNGSVSIQWQTASETLNEGWNIWRKMKGGVDSWGKINETLIPGAATAPFGEEYEFIDNSAYAPLDYSYRLEWISSDDKKEQSGPVSIGQQIGAFLSPVSEDVDDIPESAGLTNKKAKIVAEANWLGSHNRADYLIITTENLKEAAKALSEFRKTRGFHAQVITVEDIYTLFPKFGNNETAIRQFLRHAYQNWEEPKLKYVLLVGDAKMDQNGQIYSNSFVPTFVKRMPGVGEIPTDYPFTLLDGYDKIPDVAIGRIPSGSPKAIETTIRKIIRYEIKQRPTGRVVFANGDYVLPGDEYAENSSEDIIADFINGKYDVTRIYTMPISESLQRFTGGSTKLKDTFSKGCDWLEYRGHGGASVWGGLMTSVTARDLRPSKSLPIVTSVSCFTGFFADSKQRRCMAEVLLAHPSGGAVAYIGNTGHGMVFTGHDFSSELWGQIEAGEDRIGDAILNVKKHLSQTGSNKGFLHSINLLGDPALTIKLKSRK